MSNYVPCDCVFDVIFFKTMFNKTVTWFDFFTILLISGQVSAETNTSTLTIPDSKKNKKLIQ